MDGDNKTPLDHEAVNKLIAKAIADSVGPAVTQAIGPAVAAAIKPLAENQKVLADTLANLPPAGAEKKGDGVAKALTAEDVTAIVTKTVTDSLKNFQQSSQRTATRQQYAADKLKDLPEVYRNQLPETDNVDELKAAEQKIRDQYKADFKASGAAPAGAVGGDNPGGKGPEKTVDVSKLNPVQLVEAGIKQEAAALAGAGAAGGATK